MRNATISALAVCLLGALLLLMGGCNTNVRNLGGGFKLVRQPAEETDQGAAPAHARHLYYEAKDLGAVGQCFVSPSGCHALYEQNGKLMLFHSCSEKLKTVADLPASAPMQVTWSEVRNEARISSSASTNVRLVPLSACACRVENRPLARRK